MCKNFTGEHLCRSVISTKFDNFIETALWHGYSPVNFLYIFRTPCSKNTSGWSLLMSVEGNMLEARCTKRQISVKLEGRTELPF